MRGITRALCALAITSIAAPVAGAAEPLRLNDIQARGTHNSYHRDPSFPGRDGFGWAYSHAPLDRQLELQGVRQVELDIHWNWARDRFEVYHAWFADDRTTCAELGECLALLRAWSDDHPMHHPLVVLIEPKDNGPPKNTELPEDMDIFTNPFTAAEYARLDEVLLDGFGAERTLTPDDVTAPGETLRDSVLTDGWPALADLPQHIVFVLDGDDHAIPYSEGWTSLAGRTMFVQAEDATPVAAFVGRDGARLPGEGKYDRIARLAGDGYMVRDLSGPSNFEAAKAAGVHFISSDEPEQLVLSADPDAPSRCNPITAPLDCVDGDIETHAAGDWPPRSSEPSDDLVTVVIEKADRLACGTVESTAALAGIDPPCEELL